MRTIASRLIPVFLLSLSDLIGATASAEPSEPAGPACPCVIELAGGSRVETDGVRYASLDFIRYVDSQGKGKHVPSNRIRAIHDRDGVDRTRLVLEERGRIGNVVEVDARYYHSLCARSGQRDRCGSFLITEAGALIGMDDDPYAGSGTRLVGVVDMGWMKNVGSSSAVGATLFYEGGANRSRAGVRARYRAWLGDDFALDASPGLVLAASQEDFGVAMDTPAPILQLAIEYRRRIGLMVEDEAVRLESQYGTRLTRTEPTFRAGVRGGSEVGFGATLGAGLVLLALLGSMGGGGPL